MAWDPTFDWADASSFRGEARKYDILTEMLTQLSTLRRNWWGADMPRTTNTWYTTGVSDGQLSTDSSVLWIDGDEYVTYPKKGEPIGKHLKLFDRGTYSRAVLKGDFDADTETAYASDPILDSLIEKCYNTILDDGSLWSVDSLETQIGISRVDASLGGTMSPSWINWVYNACQYLTRPFRISDDFNGVLCSSATVGDTNNARRWYTSPSVSMVGGKVIIPKTYPVESTLKISQFNSLPNIFYDSYEAFQQGFYPFYRKCKTIFRDVVVGVSSPPATSTWIPSTWNGYPALRLMSTLGGGYIDFDPVFAGDYPSYTHVGYKIEVSLYTAYGGGITINYPESDSYLSGDWEIEVPDNQVQGCTVKFNGVTVVSDPTPSGLGQFYPHLEVIAYAPPAEFSVGPIEYYNSYGIKS